MAEILFGRGARSGRGRQLRTMVLVCAWGALLLALTVVLAYRLMISSYIAAEARATRQSAEQVLHAFAADLQQLAISNRNFAEWNDAAAFVLQPHRGFIDAAFVPNTFKGMHVDLVWIHDRSGRTVYSAWYDSRSGQVHEPAPAQLLRDAQPLASNPQQIPADPLNRVIATSQGLMAYAAREITHSDGSRPTGAILLFGRFADQQVLQQLRSTSHLPVLMQPLIASPLPGAPLPASVRAWLAAPAAAAILVDAVDDSRIDGYALVRTTTGEPALLFSVRLAREILALGRRTTHLLLGGFIVMFLLFGGTLLVLYARLQAAKRQSDRRYRNVAEHLGEAIMLVEPRTLRIVEANDAVFRMLGYTAAELAALNVLQIFTGIDSDAIAAACRAGASAQIVATRARRRDGSRGEIELSVTQLTDSAERMLVLVGRDISHRRLAQEEQLENERKLIHLAQHDSLTGLPNRLFLRTRLPGLLQKVSEQERSLVLVYLDVDHFKNFNDSRGHAFGDRMLQLVARRLRSVVSEHDAVVRMGGDEFVIVLSMPPDRQSIDRIAQRLHEAVSEPLHMGNSEIVVTASLGIAIHPQDGLDMDVLLKHADIALYLAKDAGRNCHRYFKANMEVRVSEDVALEQAMRHALGTEQFYMEYQPVVDLATNRVSGLEALLRWRHPDLGMIPPARFIPVAERSGMIMALGEQALRSVLAQLRDWQALCVPCVPVAVNVSVLQLERSEFAATVQRQAQQAGVDASWLHFEITESALLREQEQIVGELKRLRELGCRVLIDDFGTGYSALSYLHRLPVDGLKIDRAFVVEMARNGGQSPIIGAIVKIARELQLAVIVEGVETADQLMMLREYRCAAAQGYFFSKPIPAARCTRLLQQLDDVQRVSESTTVRVLRGSDLSLAG